MQRYIFIFISIFILASGFTACGRRPANVLSEQEMMDVLYDIQLAQAVYQNSGVDFSASQKKDALIASVLEKHNISQAELDSSLVWYSDNVKIYVQINDSVTARLKVKNDQLMALRSAAEMSMRSRTEGVLPSFAYLNESTPTLSFNIDSLKIKSEKLSDFKLQFDIQGISNLTKAEAAVFFIYKDTLVKQILPIDSNIHYIFPMPQLPDSLLKNISGYLHVRNKVTGLPDIMIYNINYRDSITGKADKSDQLEVDANIQLERLPAPERQEAGKSGSYLRQKRERN